ncbi:MAG TPA: hypothetical protein PKD73_05985 [Burkholderiaceae bacterium]|nr:hypothetical protein [Burkholderiaceae bacterium]
MQAPPAPTALSATTAEEPGSHVISQPPTCGACAHSSVDDNPLCAHGFVRCAYAHVGNYKSAFTTCVYLPSRWKAKEPRP